MNFADILDRWEKEAPANAVCDKDAALDRTAFDRSRDGGALGERGATAFRRNRLLRKKPDAYLDLHGLSSEEALAALLIFFEDSRRKGHEKVLVIHGKGNHQGFGAGEAVLRDLAKRFIETCSYAGESGFNPSKGGGKGATWVILKEKA